MSSYSWTKKGIRYCRLGTQSSTREVLTRSPWSANSWPRYTVSESHFYVVNAIAYTNFRDLGRGRIPWSRMRESQGDFILPEYLPHGTVLTQLCTYRFYKLSVESDRLRPNALDMFDTSRDDLEATLLVSSSKLRNLSL